MWATSKRIANKGLFMRNKHLLLSTTTLKTVSSLFKSGFHRMTRYYQLNGTFSVNCVVHLRIFFLLLFVQCLFPLSDMGNNWDPILTPHISFSFTSNFLTFHSKFWTTFVGIIIWDCHICTRLLSTYSGPLLYSLIIAFFHVAYFFLSLMFTL